MDCEGSAAVSTVVAGIDWVQANAVYPAVALMSLGTSASTVLDSAVQSLTAANITVVVAAGNNDLGRLLCQTSSTPPVMAAWLQQLFNLSSCVKLHV